MATADVLLNSAVNDDKTLVIDVESRTINIPKRVTNIGVESDDGTLRLEFQMPKMYCGIDLSTFIISINYVNARAKEDVYDVDDMRVDGDIIRFSWLVERQVTRYKGDVAFSVCMKNVDLEGTVINELNTTIATLPVLQGLETSKQAVAQYTNILEQWRARIFGAGDSVIANIAAEGEAQVAAVQAESETQQEAVELKGAQTLDSIPEDYTEVDAMADEAVRTKADAIVCEAAGESIALKDSSNDHIRGLKVFGKTTQKTTTGKNLLNVDENLSFTGLREKTVNIPAGTYVLTWAGRTAAGQNKPVIRFVDNSVLIDLLADVGNSKVTLAKDETTIHIYSNGYDYAASENVSATITQLMLSVDGGTYEPYTGGIPAPNPDYPQEIMSIENPEAYICGKNLLDIAKAELIVVGASGSKRYGIVFDKLGTYTFSCKTNEGIAVKVVTNGEYGDYVTLIGNVSHTFTLAENQYLIIYQGSEGKMFNAGLEDAQIESGNIATAYEPYKGRNLAIPHTLPGIPVTSGGNYTDENGQQWICDEIDLERGVQIRRLNTLVLDGSSDETWGRNDVNPFTRFVLNRSDIKYGSARAPLVCSHFTSKDISSDRIGLCFVGTTPPGQLYFYSKEGLDSWEKWCEWLAENPVTVMYELATPIETPLTAEETTAFKAIRTNYPNTTILNDAGAWMSVMYNADTKTYVEKPKTLKLVDSSTGVVYELKVVDGILTVIPA